MDKNVSKMAAPLASSNLHRDLMALAGANRKLSYRLTYVVALTQTIFSSICALTVYTSSGSIDIVYADCNGGDEDNLDPVRRVA